MPAKRYVEPKLSNPKYKSVKRKICTQCKRKLPDHPDFFSVHTVMPVGKYLEDGTRLKYQYRRPDCRKCRSLQKREYYCDKKVSILLDEMEKAHAANL